MGHKIFTINLPSQPFLGHHLGFHIFFHHSLFEGHTFFLQLGCFGLDVITHTIANRHTNRRQIRGAQYFQRGFQLKPLQPPVSATGIGIGIGNFVANIFIGYQYSILENFHIGAPLMKTHFSLIQ